MGTANNQTTSMSRVKEVRTIDTILTRAEQEILILTGLKMRVLIAPEICNEDNKDVEGLFRVVCSSLGLLTTEVAEKRRNVEMVNARHLFYHFAKIYFPSVTLKHMAYVAGGQDHTTVLHGLSKVSDLLETEERIFMTRYNTVLEAVTQWIAEIENTTEDAGVEHTDDK